MSEEYPCIKFNKGKWEAWSTARNKVPGTFTSRHMAETALRTVKVKTELAAAKRAASKKKED